jgi:hypothetical protein
MATSPARIIANQANAQLSTGPRTPEGKRASSANSTVTGLTAATIYVRPDEQAEFDVFESQLIAELKPSGATQSHLFDLILHAAWNLRRCFLLEASIQNEAIAKGLDDALLDDELSRKLDRLYRYKKMHESTQRRSMADLRQLQIEEIWRRENQAFLDDSILATTTTIQARLTREIAAGEQSKLNLIRCHLEELPKALRERIRTPYSTADTKQSHLGRPETREAGQTA